MINPGNTNVERNTISFSEIISNRVTNNNNIKCKSDDFFCYHIDFLFGFLSWPFNTLLWFKSFVCECLYNVQGQSAQLRSTLGQAQRALLGNISDALAAMNAAQNAFDKPKTPPQLGSDPVVTRVLLRLID